jgi:hypothetical protein
MHSMERASSTHTQKQATNPMPARKPPFQTVAYSLWATVIRTTVAEVLPSPAAPTQPHPVLASSGQSLLSHSPHLNMALSARAHEAHQIE